MGRAISGTGLLVVCLLALTASSAEAATQPVIFYACVNTESGYNQQKGKLPHFLTGIR